MFGTFDIARILAVLNNNNVSIGLKKAMFIAQVLMDLHSERVCQVENEAFNRGHKEGYEMGKRDAEVPSDYEMNRLRNMESAVKANAGELVRDIVQKHGSLKKIQCIKELRSKTGLGLKETKDIVDAYILKLHGLPEWERESLDASYRPF